MATNGDRDAAVTGHHSMVPEAREMPKVNLPGKAAEGQQNLVKTEAAKVGKVKTELASADLNQVAQDLIVPGRVGQNPVAVPGRRAIRRAALPESLMANAVGPGNHAKMTPRARVVKNVRNGARSTVMRTAMDARQLKTAGVVLLAATPPVAVAPVAVARVTQRPGAIGAMNVVPRETNHGSRVPVADRAKSGRGPSTAMPMAIGGPQPTTAAQARHAVNAVKIMIVAPRVRRVRSGALVRPARPEKNEALMLRSGCTIPEICAAPTDQIASVHRKLTKVLPVPSWTGLPGPSCVPWSRKMANGWLNIW